MDAPGADRVEVRLGVIGRLVLEGLGDLGDQGVGVVRLSCIEQCVLHVQGGAEI